MSQDGISRRQVLRAASVAGTFGVVGGAGASAYLSDGEGFADNGFGAGTLELRSVVEDLSDDGDYCEWSAPVGGGGAPAQIELDGPSGVVGIGLAVCANPGTVSLTLAGDTSDDPYVTLEGGECGNVLAEGPLSSVIDSLDDGVRLNSQCSHLGKLEAEDDTGTLTPEDGEKIDENTFVFEHGGEDVTVSVTDRYYKDDDELKGIDLGIDGATLCRAVVKGGGPPGVGDTTYPIPCRNEATELNAGLNSSGNQSGFSHVDIYVCDDEPCIPCTPDDPYRLFLSWSGASKATTLDLGLTATQCRHQIDGGSA